MSMQLLTFKTPIGYNKAKPITDVCVVFDFRNIAIAYRLKKFYQNIQYDNSDFRPFLLPGKA